MSGPFDMFLATARSRASTDQHARIVSLHSPEVAEILGRDLAVALASPDIDLVVVWNQVETAVLGHVVARELGANLIHAYSDQGALGATTGLVAGKRAVLISYDWSEDPGLLTLMKFVQQQGTVVAGIGYIAGTAPTNVDGISVKSLTMPA